MDAVVTRRALAAFARTQLAADLTGWEAAVGLLLAVLVCLIGGDHLHTWATQEATP